MRQIIQNLKNGETILEEVPVPRVKRGNVLIKTTKSLVSLGTERMLVEFGKANLIDKARQQPDKVKMVLDKVKSDGLMPTLETVFNKLDTPLPLGYCNVGEVVEVGAGVKDFKVGDRVASNGQHAEYVCVPENLVAHIPDKVTDEEAAFTVIGAIGLQGIRLLAPTMGETVVVIGLGLIGLITAELLKANGCRVVGVDLDPEKCKLAEEKGIIAVNPGQGTDPVRFVMGLTNQVGADGVLITASAKSNEIISQAANMSRKRGRIILVGVIGLDISRADFYEKELTFQVSCSYGPGRYDENYEQKGQDYPLPYVRWTEKRNFETILDSLATGRLDVKPLVTEVVPLDKYNEIYGDMKNSCSIASILDYRTTNKINRTVELPSSSFEPSKATIGIIGAGNFTKMTVLPAFKDRKKHIKYIASGAGLSGTDLAKKYGVPFSTTDYREMLNDGELDLAMITTRHDTHAAMTVEALKAGKHVFVEKPMALNTHELSQIVSAVQESNKNVTVGFNRRFSPFAKKVKSILGEKPGPMNIIATMNAGFIPADVWVHDMQVGGGRIIGEACHYIDLISYFTGSKVVSVNMSGLGQNPEENTDNAIIILKYENGSQGVINYFANGSKGYSKERFEVYYQEQTFILDNFKSLKAYGCKGFSKMSKTQDKGHKAQFEKLVDTLEKGGDALIPFDSLVNTTLASFAAIQSMKEERWVHTKELDLQAQEEVMDLK